MPDRLAELQRQRALVQEHLAWLEREIAATAKPAAPAVAEPVAPAAPGPAMPAPNALAAPAPAPDAPDLEKLLSQYRSAPGVVRQDVRKGCLLYFALALVALAACVTILYFALGPQ